MPIKNKSKAIAKKVRKCPHCRHVEKYGKKHFETHVEKHDNDHRRKYPCNECDKKFMDKYSVNRHKKLVHPITENVVGNLLDNATMRT